MDILHQHILLIGVVLALFCAAPLFFWRPTKALFWPVVGLYSVFLLLNWELVLGIKGPNHDTEQNLQGWMTLANQWFSWGRTFGWIPYQSGGQPFVLYNNLINFPEAILFGKFATLWGFHLSSSQVFSLAFFTAFLGFVTGSGFLFLLLFEQRSVALFGMVTLCLSGAIWVELAQPKLHAVLFGFVWVAVFLLLAIKTKKPGALILGILAMSTMLNYYVPSYALTAFALCALSGLVFYGRRLAPWNQWLPLVQSKVAWLLLLPTLFVVLGPVGYSYTVLGDYFSPTRGSIAGTVSAGNTGQQAVGSAELKYSAQWVNPELANHNSFYLGAFIVLLAPLALLSRRGWFLMAPALMLWWLSLGRATPLWDLFVSLPLMNYARHAFHFGAYSGFFLLLVGLEGLVQVRGSRPAWVKLGLLALGLLLVKQLMDLTPDQKWPEVVWQIVWDFGVLGALLAIFGKGRFKAPMLLVVLGIQFVLLAGQYDQQIRNAAVRAPRPNIAGFVNNEWFAYSRTLPLALPFFILPIEEKYNQWYHRFPEELFMVQKDFFPLLKELEADAGVLADKMAPIFHLFDLEQREQLESPEAIYKVVFQELEGNRGDWAELRREGEGDGKYCPQTGLCYYLPERPDPNLRRMQVNLEQPALLLRLVNWDAHWKARAGGKELAIHRAAYNMQYVELPAGAYDLEFHYQDAYDSLFKLNLIAVFLGWVAKCFWLRRQEAL